MLNQIPKMCQKALKGVVIFGGVAAVVHYCSHTFGLALPVLKGNSLTPNKARCHRHLSAEVSL